MKKNLLIFLFSFLLFACKKESTAPVPETIEPGNYLPVYPGSYWKYLKNDTDTFINSTSPSYITNSFVTDQYHEKYSVPTNVPYLNGEAIYGYKRVEHIPAPFGDYYQLWTILSETVGYSFTPRWLDPRITHYWPRTVVKDKTINANLDSILILETHGGFNYVTTYIYTKNIGLTSEIEVDTINNDTTYKYILIDYYINR